MNSFRDRWAAWLRWSADLALLVLAAYGLLAVAWFAGGPYVFARPGNPDSTFPGHWLAKQNAMDVQITALVICAVTVAALVLMRRRVAGFLRPLLLAVAWSVSAFLVLVLPGFQGLDAVPRLNLLNLKRLAWPTVHLVLPSAVPRSSATSPRRFPCW